jgi:ABC-type lipopolysaccharide export system ATPase subunit
MPSETTGALLAVAGLAKVYDGRPIITGSDLAVAAGSAAALMGPNGLRTYPRAAG